MAHESVLTTLSASAWLNILKAFELELRLALLGQVLLAHGVVCMDLSIRHSDSANVSLALTSLLLPIGVACLEGSFTLATVRVRDDTIDGSLGPISLAKGGSRVGQAHANLTTGGLLRDFEVVSLAMGTVGLK